MSLGGFDTHSNQLFQHAALLTQLSEALAAFQKDLEAKRLDSQVATMTFSEFGRRPSENDSRGTDHGTAAPLFVLGSKVKGGLHGTPASLKLERNALEELAQCCDEFLVHAVDVEGLCQGIDRELIGRLADASPIPTTYAGGANSLADLEEVTRVGRGRLDLTIGSALDIFGGSGVRYEDCVEFNRRQAALEPG